jgi:hypothetical protein
MYETWFKQIGLVSVAPEDQRSMRGGAVMTISRLLLNIETRE